VSCNTTAIAALVPRQRTIVAGEIELVSSFDGPWVRTDAIVADGTGAVILRFMGRATVPGMPAGRRVIAQGTQASSGAPS
jgi:hypothetical protein